MDKRCENCGCGLDGLDGLQACPACGRSLHAHSAHASAGAFGDRRYEAGPAPVGTYDIKLGAGDAIGATFKLWSENLARLAALGFVPYLLLIPFVAVAGFLMFTPGLAGAFDALDLDDWDTTWPLWAAAGVGVGGLFMVVSLASTAACIHLVDEKTQGVSVTVWGALLASLRHVGWMLVATVFLGALWMVGLAAPIVPLSLAIAEESWTIASLTLPALFVTAAVFVLVARLLPLLPVIIVEDASFFTALGRAWSLTSGRTGRVVGAALAFGVAYFGVSMAVGMVGIIPFVGAILQMGANAMLMPLAYVFTFVVYAGCVRETTIR